MEDSTFADMVDLFFGPGQEVRASPTGLHLN
jgi:hypothetical protein